MKLQNLTIIFIIIVLPVILLTTFYISTGLKTIKYQALYDTGLITATQDAIQAFELNSLNNKYSGNAETKRSIIKSSVKMLETSLCSTCNISSYNTDEIEEYIPAIMFGLSDGFYVYAPSLNPTTNEYEHSLKSYVYYSESLTGNTSDGVVIYHLDSYVEISGYFNGSYESQEGYLINADKVVFEWDGNEYKYKDTTYPIENFYKEYKKELAKDKDDRDLSKFSITYYNNTEIDMYDQLAVNYFVDNYKFSKWFDETVISNIDASTTSSKYAYLKVIDTNDPEDPESEFSKHKKELIKSKIEGVLNSTITAYSKRNYGQEYKMPKLSEEDWEKIYTDVSVTTFFQGKKIGLTKYNGYCVLNSNNNYETINPNLLYFSTDGDATNSSDDDGKINTTSDYYHDIRCSELKELTDTSTKEVSTGITTIRGWKIGRFQKIKTQDDATEYNSDSTEVTTERTYTKYNKYMYERAELACYSCINGSVGNTSVYDYIAVANSSSHTGNTTNTFIKESYWTSLARERAKLHDDEAEIPSNLSITKSVAGIEEGTYNDPDGVLTVINGSQVKYTITVTNNVAKTDTINIKDDFDLDSGKISGNATVSSYSADGRLIYNQNINFNTFELTELTIVPNGKIEIIYIANITDRNGDGEVNNTATVAAGEYKASTKATCKTLESNIKIDKKIKVADAEVDKVEFGSEVEYEITITNNSTLPDKVNIEDIFYNNEIEITSAITASGIAESSKQGEDDSGSFTNGPGNVIGNKRKKWENISLAASSPDATSSITIKYKAKLTADIGSAITNTARVKSVYTGDEAWKTCTTTCTIQKTITTRNTYDDYNVVLVLDRSTSMSDGDINAVYNASKDLIEILGNDKVKILAFSQGAVELETGIDEYKNWVNNIQIGISTNYTGALKKALDMCDNNKNNYIVFMSDGAPTNTQDDTLSSLLYDVPTLPTTTQELWTAIVKFFNGESLQKILNDAGINWRNFFKVALNPIKYISGAVWNLLCSVYGGWVETTWEGENIYGCRLLAVQGIFDELDSFSDAANVSKNAWTKHIMPKVENIANGNIKMYTVYFSKGNYEETGYGLKMMAGRCGGQFYDSKSYNTLRDHFTDIATKIKEGETPQRRTYQTSTIEIEDYQKISKITIGSKSYTDTNLQTIKNQITPIEGTDNGTLNLNQVELNGEKIFKTNSEITITYKN